MGYLQGPHKYTWNLTEQARHYADYIAQRIEDIYNKNESKNQIKRIYITGGGSRMEIVVEQLKEALKIKISAPCNCSSRSKPCVCELHRAHLELLMNLTKKKLQEIA